jgi:hypothetical protein
MSCFLYTDDEESTQKVNIDELYENKQKRDLKQLSIFNKILNRIHRRIQFTGRNKKIGETHIWFAVPEYIFGEPIYDKGDCIAYLVLKLQDNGFLVKYVHPNTLFVSWSNWIPAYVRAEFRKKTGKLMDEKGNVTEVREDGTSQTYSVEDINTRIFNDPRNIGPTQIKDNSKPQFTPIAKYKPTGNLVYNPDILEKIEKKVSFSSMI